MRMAATYPTHASTCPLTHSYVNSNIERDTDIQATSPLLNFAYQCQWKNQAKFSLVWIEKVSV